MDQVSYRWAARLKPDLSRLDLGRANRPIVMVDQLWMWMLDDGRFETHRQNFLAVPFSSLARWLSNKHANPRNHHHLFTERISQRQERSRRCRHVLERREEHRSNRFE
jgi:hypothetical protein